MSFHDPYRPSSARPDGAQAPKSVDLEPKEQDPVPSGTSKEVLSWVSDDKDRAQRALDKESSNDEPRKGLTRDLNEVLSAEDSKEE